MSQTPSTHEARLRSLPETECRQAGLALDPTQLATVIPHGLYCYTVLSVHPATPTRPSSRDLLPCPFYRGRLPMNTYCLLNPSSTYRQDWLFNVDATKGCGINEPSDDDINTDLPA